MRNRTLMLSIAAVLAIPFAAAASPPHSFVEGSYRNLDGDLDGLGARASFAVAPRLHVLGEFSHVSDSPFRAEQGTLALGFHHGFTPNTDLVLRGGWTQVRDRTDIDLGDSFELGSLRDDGFAAQAGVRSMLTDAIELNGFVKHEEVFGGDTRAAVGGVFGFTPALGVTGNVEFGDDDTLYEVGLRWSFGRA